MLPNESVVSRGIRSYLASVGEVLERLPSDTLERMVARLEEARQEGQSVFTCGNGGSAATAIHLACDLAKGAAVPGQPGIKTMSLCENVSLVTAWANDTSYDQVFVRRMAPWVEPGDVLIAISGSGNSPNVLEAAAAARRAGATVLALTGFEGGKLRELSDLCLVVPSNDMEQIEDVHMVLCHILTASLRTASVPSLTIAA